MRIWIPLLPGLLVLASCSSPPKPPTVDESQRRPVNSQTAVELQVCRNDLHNTRILAAESGRLAESTAAALANIAAQRQILASIQVRERERQPEHKAAPVPPPNSLYSVRFEFGSTRVAIPADIAPTLIAEARTAPLVLLRGRTDGSTESPAESRIARERAGAVRDYLVAAGVEPSHIRATYQPTGDPVADNTTAGGRGLNRRVEIELYRALPVALGSATRGPVAALH